VGIGVLSGARGSVRRSPGAGGGGIVFRRTDLGVEIQARVGLVADSRVVALIAEPASPAARVGTGEHLVAALAAAGIDNAIVAVDGPELPIFDGSSAPYTFLIDCAGIAPLAAPRRVIELTKSVRVEQGGAWAEIVPLAADDADGLHLTMTIEFASTAIGRQSFAFQLSEDGFRRQLARARTFGLAEEVEALRAAGLGRGGSLDNAVVVDGDRVLNPGGLRFPDEFVRHKLLDAVGDLALAGAPLAARFTGHRSGHALNNRLLRALMADPSAWRWADEADWHSEAA
jgi:UDP-3-O-[3-hydroxymyristoyl] N-acetylglucosamine deacetylase